MSVYPGRYNKSNKEKETNMTQEEYKIILMNQLKRPDSALRCALYRHDFGTNTANERYRDSTQFHSDKFNLDIIVRCLGEHTNGDEFEMIFQDPMVRKYYDEVGGWQIDEPMPFGDFIEEEVEINEDNLVFLLNGYTIRVTNGVFEKIDCEQRILFHYVFATDKLVFMTGNIESASTAMAHAWRDVFEGAMVAGSNKHYIFYRMSIKNAADMRALIDAGKLPISKQSDKIMKAFLDDPFGDEHMSSMMSVVANLEPKLLPILNKRK